MSTVKAIYHFDVGGVWVWSEVRGTRHTAEVDGRRCTLIFPAHDRDFDWSPYDPSLMIGWRETPAGERIKWAIRWLRVEVELPSDLKASDFPLEGLGEPFPTALTLLRDGSGTASTFVSQVLRQIMVKHRQFWLGPSVRQFTFGQPAYLLDRDGVRIPLNYQPTVLGTKLRPQGDALTARGLEALINELSFDEESETPLPETLLADALHTSEEAEHRDLRLGTLMAAVACEVKVKETMKLLANDDQVALVEAILSNPRDWSLAASALFDKGMKAICGRSLKDEDRDLWKAIDRLFFVRNKIAHVGGQGLPEEALKGHVQVAVRAFEWLDGLQGEFK